MKMKFLFCLLFLCAFCISSTAFAQSNTDLPFYTVQPGETLSIIAEKFSVTINEIVSINGISNPDIISPGTRLLIPGLKGINGELTTKTLNLGENIDILSQKYLIPRTTLIKVNRLTSPNEVYAGSDLIISIDQMTSMRISASSIQEGQSILDQSILLRLNPWFLPVDKMESYSKSLFADEYIYLPERLGYSEKNPISPLIKSISIIPLPLFQGNTEIIKLETVVPMDLSGHLKDHELHFFSNGGNQYFAYQGIHAMAETGLASLVISGESEKKATFSFQQMLLVKPSAFLTDPPLNVKDQTVDPEITKPEEDFVKSLVTNVSPDKFWQGKFEYPIDEPICYRSIYGNRRSYNNGSLISFHTGLDFGVCAPSLNVYSSAAGKVVFAGELAVRGWAIFIDHGQGIFSGYFHQRENELKVRNGDLVQAHQLIGMVGSTGRVTGPHLHFEIWVNGVQVNPVDWFQKDFPNVNG
jgi:murein DD-endopeptidase MepM/ murein hydrolase activator NlpD